MGIVRVLCDGETGWFHLDRAAEGRRSGPGAAAWRPSEKLVLVRTLTVEDEVGCVAMIYRLLGSKQTGDGHHKCFQADPGELEKLLSKVERIFHELAQARQTAQDSAAPRETGKERAAEPLDHALHGRLRQLRQERRALDLQLEWLELKLKERACGASGIRGIASWKVQKRRLYDEEIFRQREPDYFQDVLERFHRVDTSAWRRQQPEEYRRIQTSCYREKTSRVFRLLP